MKMRSASNMDVKKLNRNQIFRYINRRKRVSKPEIAAALQLSIPTVMQNVNELIEQGLVRQVGEFKSTGGRKATAIAPIQERKYAIGIDITRNHISFVLTDLSGEVLQHARVYQPYANEVSYYQQLADLAAQYKIEWKLDDDDQFLGYGISIPGIINSENKKITFSHALEVSNISCDKFAQFIPYPCVYINDANAAAYAEIYVLEERYDAVFISLSNSVGGAVIKHSPSYLDEDNLINDRLYMGDNWRSGELGHVTLIPEGKKCYCGKQGCLDAYCSAGVLSKHTGGRLEVFFDELEKGNEELRKVWEEYLYYLSVQVNNLRMTFDSRVIIGGYVGSFIEPYLEQLRAITASRNTFEEDASYVLTCRYKIEASALGAALQQIEAFISTI